MAILLMIEISNAGLVDDILEILGFSKKEDLNINHRILSPTVADVLGQEKKEPIEIKKEEKVTYTPSTETHCIGNKCVQTIYSSIRFADDEGTKIKDAESLKDKGFYVEFLEYDKEFPLEVLDFNYSSITVKLKPAKENIGKDLPVKTYRENKNDVKFSTEHKFSSLSDSIDVTIPMKLGDTIVYGFNSTEVMIKANDTGNKGYKLDYNTYPYSKPSSLILGTEFTSTEYEKMGWDDGNEYTLTPSYHEYAMVRLNYTIPIYSSLNWIYSSQQVDGFSGETLDLHIWDFTDSQWDVVVDGIGIDSETNVDYNLTTDFSRYVVDNKFHVMYVGLSSYTNLDNDYAYINISYELDSGPPTYSLNSTNTTLAGNPTLFSLNWTDDTALDSYIFSFYNGNNTSTCTGTLDCSGYSTEASCDNCSECLWTAGGADPSDTEDFSSDSDWATWQGVNSGFFYETGDASRCIYDANKDCMCYDENTANVGDDIDKQSDFDMSTCVDGTANVTFTKLFEGGVLESGDCLNVSFSNDNGDTWGDFYKIACDDVEFDTGGPVTVEIPDAYLVSGFRMRIHGFNHNGGTGEVMCVDGIIITCTAGDYCADDGDCSSCDLGECDTNCSTGGCSVSEAEFVNDTSVAFGAGTWSNTTKTVNSTVGSEIKWCYYANDTADNWNGSSCINPFSYITTTEGEEDTCTCTGIDTNWEIDLSDYCVITDDCDLGTGTLSFINDGNVTCDARIDTTNLGDVGSGNIMWVNDECLIIVD